MNATMNAATTPRDLMTRLMDGYLSTQMLYVAARLGLVDALIDGPRTSTELAAVVNAASAPLHRLLRGLVLEGVLSEQPKSCRNAIPDHGRGRVLIVDAILGERVHDQPAAVRMDLHMLTLASGRERTAAEVATLLHAASLRIARILAPSSAPAIQIVEAVPQA